MKNEIKTRLVQKHDIPENWAKAGNAENPFIPLQGEIIVYDIDENYNYERFKIGDGVTNVDALPFFNETMNSIWGDFTNNTKPTSNTSWGSF